MAQKTIKEKWAADKNQITILKPAKKTVKKTTKKGGKK